MGGTVNINYLAVHSRYQGTKIAETGDGKIYLEDILLNDCEKRILELKSKSELLLGRFVLRRKDIIYIKSETVMKILKKI